MKKEFFGIQKVTIDERGRLSFPSVLKATENSLIRVKEGEEFLVSVWGEGRVTFFKIEKWYEYMGYIKGKAENNVEDQRYYRRVEEYTEKHKVDSAGRILLPDSIRRFTDISIPSKKKEFLSIEEDHHLCLWSQEGWKAEEDWFRKMGAKQRMVTPPALLPAL